MNNNAVVNRPDDKTLATPVGLGRPIVPLAILPVMVGYLCFLWFPDSVMRIQVDFVVFRLEMEWKDL